jgi:anti-anti-sigma factor
MNTVEVHLAGELDLATIDDAIDRILAGDDAPHQVIVDASEVTFIDCAGLDALLTALDELQLQGSNLTVQNPSHEVEQLMEITRTVALFQPWTVDVGVVELLGHSRDELLAALQYQDQLLAAKEQATLVAQERERIAHDLNDTVIQQLFRAGLVLQGTVSLANDTVAERLETVITILDDTIRQVRTAIFALEIADDAAARQGSPPAN